MPPKRKSQPPQRSSERLKIKMSNTNDKTPIDLSTPTPPPEKKNKRAVTNKKPPSSGPEEQDDESPIRHHLIVTKEEDVKRFEELDDCFILGFDQVESIEMKKLSVADEDAGSPEIAVVAEKGQVACRDYPHPRHLCVKFPFETTSHETHCELCYCYVCDTAAPCKSWSSSSNNALLSHCDAYDNSGVWKRERTLRKQLSAVFKQ
ncbi:RPM1 interacting protein 13-like [Rosa rugosa]|uniref:RPM1 interacting protein 13-like n=1 Tax=Rosa rugosa TaxID=74645 RepID=UPI002B403745|nr:RPM1 interacting protein 13-like [Rosa rugosa]